MGVFSGLNGIFGGSSLSYLNFSQGENTATIVIVISLVIALGAYFMFLTPKNEGRFNGFQEFVYEFLNFQKFLLGAIVKILYLFITCIVTFSSIIMLFEDFMGGLVFFVATNVTIRIVYEFMMILVVICKNTTQINKKLSKNDKEANSKEQFVSHVELGSGVVGQVVNKVSDNIIPKVNHCSACGQGLKSDDLFCPNCGTKTK